jgi:two-component system, NarL family, sensor kinase
MPSLAFGPVFITILAERVTGQWYDGTENARDARAAWTEFKSAPFCHILATHPGALVPKRHSAESSSPKHPSPASGHGSEEPRGADARIFREMIDHVEVAIAAVTPDGEILYANPTFAKILAFPDARDLSGWNLRETVSVASWESIAQALNQAVLQPVEGELGLKSSDGNDRTLRMSFRLLHASPEPAILVAAQEVTELVKSNKALHESQTSLRNLSARILQVQDEERRRMARDLHDTTGQELVALDILLQSLAKELAQRNDSSQKTVLEAIAIGNKVNAEIRTLSYLLHPPLLDELGLGSALEWYVEGLMRRSELDVNLDKPAKLPRFSAEKEIALFRVIQAALTNVVRHAQTKKAWIRVLVVGDQIQVSVMDKGKGIDAATLARVSDSSRTLGVGISGMRERLGQLGGTLEVTSGKQGTRVTAILPLEAVEEEGVSGVSEAAHGARSTPGSETNARKRVLIVDDHEVVRRGIRNLLNDQEDLEVCGEAANGNEAVTKTTDLHPDIVILDLIMPEAGGLVAAQRIRKMGANTKILAFTSHTYRGLESMVQSVGCDGYVLKSYAARDLLRGVRELLAGRTFFSEGLQRRANSA